MGTLADKLQYLLDTKNAIKSAIIAKGVTVEDTDTFRSYADKVASISPSWNADFYYSGSKALENLNISGSITLNKSSDSNTKCLILPQTYNLVNDTSFELLLHFKLNNTISRNRYIFSMGSEQYKTIMFGMSGNTNKFLLSIGNGVAWIYDTDPFTNFNFNDYPECYIKMSIQGSNFTISILNLEDKSILATYATSIPQMSGNLQLVLGSSWNISGSGVQLRSDIGTYILSDSYIKINDTVVQGILK